MAGGTRGLAGDQEVKRSHFTHIHEAKGENRKWGQAIKLKANPQLPPATSHLLKVP